VLRKPKDLAALDVELSSSIPTSLVSTLCVDAPAGVVLNDAKPGVDDCAVVGGLKEKFGFGAVPIFVDGAAAAGSCGGLKVNETAAGVVLTFVCGSSVDLKENDGFEASTLGATCSGTAAFTGVVSGVFGSAGDENEIAGFGRAGTSETGVVEGKDATGIAGGVVVTNITLFTGCIEETSSDAGSLTAIGMDGFSAAEIADLFGVTFTSVVGGFISPIIGFVR
jgi:hypothetical protein